MTTQATQPDYVPTIGQPDWHTDGNVEAMRASRGLGMAILLFFTMLAAGAACGALALAAPWLGRHPQVVWIGGLSLVALGLLEAKRRNVARKTLR